MTNYEGVMGRLRNIPIALRHPTMARRFVRHRVFPDLIDISPAEIAQHVRAPAVILEAGAYNGDDTLRLAAQWPQAAIYPFEPIPALFDGLCDRLAHLTNVHPQPYALGAINGSAKMWLSRFPGNLAEVGPSSATTPPAAAHLASKWSAFDGCIEVGMRTVDSWLAEQGIAQVDLAWLDLQGAELPTLQASPTFTASLAAAVLEVARVEFYEGQPLYPEVMSWMKDAGFRVSINRVPVPFGNALFVRQHRGG